MYIYNADRLARESSGTRADSPAAFNETSDINFFNAQLNPTAESNKSTGPLLPDLSTPNSALGRAKRGVSDRLQNKETKEAHALPHSLGLANFELVLPIKVIGMGVKCVDKISSLA